MGRGPLSSTEEMREATKKMQEAEEKPAVQEEVQPQHLSNRPGTVQRPASSSASRKRLNNARKFADHHEQAPLQGFERRPASGVTRERSNPALSTPVRRFAPMA